MGCKGDAWDTFYNLEMAENLKRRRKSGHFPKSGVNVVGGCCFLVSQVPGLKKKTINSSVQAAKGNGLSVTLTLQGAKGRF